MILVPAPLSGGIGSALRTIVTAEIFVSRKTSLMRRVMKKKNCKSMVLKARSV